MTCRCRHALAAALLLAAAACGQTTQPAPATRPTPAVTLVDVNIDVATVDEAVRQFSNQTRLPLRLSRKDINRPVKIVAKQTPLLEALGDLCEQGGLSPFPHSLTQAVTLVPFASLAIERPAPGLLAFLSYVQCDSRRDLLPAPPDTPRPAESPYAYTLEYYVLSDPAQHIVGMSRHAVVTEATWPHASPLLITEPARPAELKGQWVPVFRCSVTLRSDRPIDHVDRLPLRLGIWRGERWGVVYLSLADIEAGRSAAIDGLTITPTVPKEKRRHSTLNLRLTGDLIQPYFYPTERMAVGSCVRIYSVGSPLSKVIVAPASSDPANKGKPDGSLNFMLSGLDVGDDSWTDTVEGVELALPTAVRFESVPIEMKNIELPD